MRAPKSLSDAIFKDLKKRWNPACRAVIMSELENFLDQPCTSPLCQWVFKQNRKNQLNECTGCSIWDGKPLCCLEIRNILFYIGIDDFGKATRFTEEMRDKLAAIADKIDMDQT